MMKSYGLKLTFALFVASCLVASAHAVDLINTSFEDADGWANYTTGVHSVVANDGTWLLHGYANGGDTRTGTRKIGFNLATRYLVTPAKDSPGVLSFWVTKSSATAIWTVDVEKSTNGVDWTNLTSFTADDITWNGTVISSYMQMNVPVNETTSGVQLRWYMTARSAGSAYFDDVILTEYSVSTDDPIVDVTPPSLSFGPVLSDEVTTHSVNVANNAASTLDLTISSPGFTFDAAGDAANFSVIGASFPVVLQPGEDQDFVIQYNPLGASGAAHATTATLVSDAPSAKTVLVSGSTYLDVPDIATLRAQGSGAKVRLTGEAVVTIPTAQINPSRNGINIQDASGPSSAPKAVAIDDPSANLGLTCVVGDVLSNVVGTLGTYGQLLQLTPAAGYSATLVRSGDPEPTPLEVTASTVYDDIESVLIRINDADIAETGAWAASTNYNLTAPASLPIVLIRVWAGCGAIGETIPDATFDVIGLAAQYNGTGQIFPRFAEDIITPSSEVTGWMMFE